MNIFTKQFCFCQSLGYHSRENDIWQEKQNMTKNSPNSESQVRSKSLSPQHNSSSIVLNQSKNLLKRRTEHSLQQMVGIDRKHARTEGIQNYCNLFKLIF